MSRPHTVDGKRVKQISIDTTESCPATTEEIYQGSESCQFLDDVRVIGFELHCHATLGATPAMTEGHGIVACDLSRSGDITKKDSVLARVNHIWEWVTEIVVATQVAGLAETGIPSIVVMFPEGYGIDFDENEELYLHAAIDAYCLSAGVLKGTFWAQIYYVER